MFLKIATQASEAGDFLKVILKIFSEGFGVFETQVLTTNFLIKKKSCITEMYMNTRLSATTLIFMAKDYLILMSEKYLHFIERQKHHCVSVFRNFLVRIFPHLNQKNSE